MLEEKKFSETLNGLPVSKPINKVITSIKDIPDINFEDIDYGKIQMTEELNGRRLALFPTKLLIKNPLQLTNRILHKNLKGLSHSIEIFRLLQPALIAQVKKKFYLLDGHRRAASLYLQGVDFIDATIIQATNKQVLEYFIECNDPKNVKQIKKKDYLMMYLKRKDAPIPKNVTRDLIFIVDLFGKKYIEFMVKNNMATGTIKTCVSVAKELNLTSKTDIKKFIKWAIDYKSIYFIKSFSRIKRDEKNPGNTAKVILNSFKKKEQLVVNVN